MPDGPKSGLVLSDSITVGQLTFVLRIAVQILSYGGLAIIGTLVLANTPRLAPIATHDVISRNVGAATSLKSTAKWLFSRIRRNSADPYPPTNLFLALLLSITYAGFVALSDVGFLGFYSCDVPGKSHYDTPASANSTSAALSVLTSNLINGTDPNQIKAFRCDSYEVLDMGSNVILDHCTSWKNGTYGDASFFNGLNTTDTDVLMPRQLNFYNNSGSGKVYLNNYYNGLGTVLNPNRQIINGLAIDPHEQGLTAIIGVPTVQPDFAVTLDRAIGLEVDIGCMTTGIIAGHTIGATQSIGWNAFSTTGDWRRFAGPEYMRDILSKTVDDVRAAYRPSFDGWPTNSDGGIYNLNDTDIVLNRAANIQSWRIPTANFTVPDPGPPILGNCTQAMMQKLGIKDGKDAKPGDMCGLLGLGGQITYDGELAKGFTRMVCATAAQVNMVRATVGVSVSNDISMSFTRRPSDLFNTRADLWDEGASPFNSSVTQFLTFEPYARYTLSDNPQGQTQHYIQHESLLLSESSQGVGSAGPAIAGLGHSMVNWPSGFSSDPEYAGLGLLPEGFNALNFTLGPNIVTNWIAQIGASALVNSVGYNGWVSHDSSPILVESTGGHAGTCYTTPYAFGFLPLLAAAFVVILWALMMIVKRSYTGSDIVKNAYGGMATYTSTVCPGAPKDTLVVWEQGSEPRLQVVNKGMPVVGDGSVTALKYLKSGPTYPYA